MESHYVTRPSVTINGHLSRSRDWIITSNVTGNFLVCAFGCIYLRVFARSVPRSTMVRYRVCSPWNTGCMFPTWWHHFLVWSSHNVGERSPHHVLANLHPANHLILAIRMGVWTCHGGLHLHFPDGLWGCALFIWWKAILWSESPSLYIALPLGCLRFPYIFWIKAFEEMCV